MSVLFAAAFLYFGSHFQRQEIGRQVELRLADSAVMLRSHVADSFPIALNDSDPEAQQAARQELQDLVLLLSREIDLRFTLVAPDGEVIADSERDPKSMLNHADRSELIEAGVSGRGASVRSSPTLQIEMQYMALAMPVGENKPAFVRVSGEIESINQIVSQFNRFWWLLVFALGVAGTAIAAMVVGRIIHPIARLTERAQAIASGEDREPLVVESKDEVGLLSASFNQMQSQLAKRFRQLRESNQQMATVLSSMDEGIIAVDANENIVLANDASKRFLNVPQEIERGRHILEVIRNRPLHELVQECLTAGSEGGSIKKEFESTSHQTRDLSVHATCLPGDPVRGVVVVLHDISELRRLENLRQEFVANVSHELKTPLASIKAFAETLRMGAVNDKENNLRFISHIEEQAERLHQLIMDMLHIARVESGEEAFDITSVRFDTVTQSCVAQHTESARHKDIDLILEPPPIEVSVRVDEDGLRTILDNLISNAIKYTPNGGKVMVRWRDDGRDVVLEVEDTGLGIAEEDQARVFERFFRVDKARSSELGGTGLGLSIVKHLSQSFGGSVVIESSEGSGSVFRVRLPNAESQAQH